MTDRQITHGPGCWDWGPRHYECALQEIKLLVAEWERVFAAKAEAEARAERLAEALEAALMVMTSKEVRLEKQADAITMVRSQLARLRDAVHAAQTPRACTCHPDDRPDGPCRERYAASECQALAAHEQLPADDEVVFIDGVGAARSSVKSCRDGVQWIRVGDRVYWPLSDSDAKRLHRACCGDGSFAGPDWRHR